MESIIRIDINSFQYQDEIILKDVHLDIKYGECIVLTGLSGCGKSTLLRLLNRLVPDIYDGTLNGSIKVLGKDIYDYKVGELACFVSNVFQNMNDQFLSLNIEDEIALVGENMGMEHRLLKEKVNEAMRQFDLLNLKDTPIRDLSFGQKQKVAIASTLVFNTQVIVFDEPSASMDCASIQELRNTLKQLKKMHKTILIAEHRLYYISDLLDRLVVMNDGTIDHVYQKYELTKEVQLKHQLRSFSEEDLEFRNHTMLEKSVLEIKDIQVQNKGYKLSYPITFDLKENECMALLAKNGVGKTTLAKQLIGVLDIRSGSTTYGDTKKKRMKVTSICMQNASNMFFYETIEKELISKEQLQDEAYKKKVKQLLIELDLFDKRTEHPQVLSGGEKQRLSIALAVLKESDLIIFDEPTAGLDYKRMDSVSNLIRKVSLETPVIVITHDTELLSRVANTALLMGMNHYEKIPVQGNKTKILAFLKGK